MITSTEPKVEQTGRYGFCETARLLGVSRPTLYKWRDEGKIKQGFRAINGRPFFSGKEILRAWRAEWGI